MSRFALGAMIAAALALCTAYSFGYYHGKQSVKLADFKEYKETVQARDALQEKLNASDVALQKAQEEAKAKRSKEVVKYVTVYRDRIKDAATAECVRTSGLLDLYDASVSAASK